MIKSFKKGNILVAVAVMLAVSLAAFAMNFTVAKADNVDEKPAANVVLDMDLTAAWLEKEDGTKIENVTADNTEGLNFFGGDGSTKMSWTDGNSRVNVKFAKKYKAEYFDTVEVKIAVAAKGTVTGYKLGTTESAGSIDSNGGNSVATLVLEATSLADENGYIQGFTYVNTGAKSNDWFDYVKLVLGQPKVDEKPEDNLILDMDGTSATLKAEGGVNDKNFDNAIKDLFTGAKGETKMVFTNNKIEAGGTVTVKFGKAYKAEYFSTVYIKLAAGTAGEKVLNVYASTDTAFENSVGTVTLTRDNENVILSLDAAKLSDKDGYIGGFVIKKTAGVSGQIFADYVELVLAEEKAPTENVKVDMNDVDSWLEIDGLKTSDKLRQGAADDNEVEGLFPGADNSTKMCLTTDLGHEESFTIKFAKKIKAEYFEKIKVELVIGNWANTGNAITTTAYALTDTEFTKPAGKIKTLKGNVYKVLAIDPALVADADGYIEGFVIRKTETDTAAKGQYFVNGVEFCLVGSEPKPVVSKEYIEKDISEVMPAGSGVTFNVKTDAQNLNKTTVQSAVKTAAFDKLNFKITPNANGKFSTYVLMKAPTATSTYEDGGIFFWISNDNVVIGNKENSESADAAEFPENAFVSGQTTTVSIAAIPYYLDGTHAGYYCAIYVNGSENALVEIYLDIESCETGVYTNVLTQDLGNDYVVAYASASATPKPAAEVMNVKLATTSGKTEFTNPRAGLTLSHFEVAGEIVGDLVIEGDATFADDTKFLTFTKEGTVKVYYTVKNAFGEFKSNELTLTYATGKPTDSGNSQRGSCKGCGGSVAGVSALSALAVAAVVVIAKKKKKD